MADTKHTPTTLPVEGDGVNYKGIGWFVAILVGTVVFCQVFVWGLFEFTAARVTRSDVARAPLAAAPAVPKLEGGRLEPGWTDGPKTPVLLVDEPTVLRGVRSVEDRAMAEYGWVNQATGVVRLPIDKAKDLAAERGFPVRGAAAAAPVATK